MKRLDVWWLVLGLFAFLWVSAAAVDQFKIVGNKVFLNGNWIKFKGIGLSCTEYMLKPHMDDASSYPGYWGALNCFGGANKLGESMINYEINNVISYLNSSSFSKQQIVTKVGFESPYNQVVSPTAPRAYPIVRIPILGSGYLYDDENDTGDHTLYSNVIDKLVTVLTNQNITVILDLHWDCPDTTTLAGCKTGAPWGQPPLPQKSYGNLPGARAFWDIISTKYAPNPFVFYELYSKPSIDDFQTWYAGNDQYCGMRELYDTIRANDPYGIIIIGGAQQYALDGTSGIGFYLRYKRENNTYPQNVMWNILPFFGSGQGLERSIRSIMRFSLSLQTVGPVIFTEVRQHCCGVEGQSCNSATCTDHAHGDYYVYNIINMCEQYDISWLGWAWRGNNNNSANRPCKDGQTVCSMGDMRSADGLLTDGTSGGANWSNIWASYVASPTVSVNDVGRDKIGKADVQLEGFLPRPCIVGEFNTGGYCGIDLSVPISNFPISFYTAQSVYQSILPGLPPNGNCSAQGCKDFPCMQSSKCPS